MGWIAGALASAAAAARRAVQVQAAGKVLSDQARRRPGRSTKVAEPPESHTRHTPRPESDSTRGLVPTMRRCFSPRCLAWKYSLSLAPPPVSIPRDVLSNS